MFTPQKFFIVLKENLVNVLMNMRFSSIDLLIGLHKSFACFQQR